MGTAANQFKIGQLKGNVVETADVHLVATYALR
jgi:hypothetical protein